MAKASTTTDPRLNGNHDNVKCWLIYLPDREKSEKIGKQNRPFSFSRRQGFQGLKEEIGQDWKYLVTKPSEQFLTQILSNILYLYVKSNDHPEPNSSNRCSSTTQTNTQLSSNHPSRQSSRCCCPYWPCKKIDDRSSKYNTSPKQSTITESLASYSQNIRDGLFVHVYCTISSTSAPLNDQVKEINKIIFLPYTGDNSISLSISKIVNDYKENMSITDLDIIKNKPNANNGGSLLCKSHSVVTVVRKSSTVKNWCGENHVESYEAAIRLYIESIVLDQKYSFNFEQFLNYCDRKKAFKLERRELEAALLTLVELFRDRFAEFSPEGLHLTYYDLLIPDSDECTWEYNDCKRIFASTLIEYIYTKQLLLTISKAKTNDTVTKKTEEIFTEFIPQFLSCLMETLDDLLQIKMKNHSKETAYLICKTVCIYLCNYLCPPIISFITICNKKHRTNLKKNDQLSLIIAIEIFKVICWVNFIYSLFNIGQFYWRSTRPFEANELEIYWPSALIISAITVINVYQGSRAYRDRSRENNSIREIYEHAYQTVLEMKAKPIKVNKDSNNTVHIERCTDENQRHPTLVQGAITQALTSNGSKTICEYFGSSRYCLALLYLLFPFLVGISVIRSFIPLIYRSQIINETSVVLPWQINSIRIAYVVYSSVFYSLLLVTMTFSISKYWFILTNLKRLLSSTELTREIDLETHYFLNLRDADNLEYFLSLFRPIKRKIDPYHVYMSTMACALVINIILILTVVIHIFVYEYSIGLLAISCLFDIFILSTFIIIFLIIVVLINKILMYDLILHLRSLKKSMVTPSIRTVNCQDTITYIDSVIEHMECASKEYTVKLLGLVVDQKLVIKVLISACAGIASSIFSLARSR